MFKSLKFIIAFAFILVFTASAPLFFGGSDNVLFYAEKEVAKATTCDVYWNPSTSPANWNATSSWSLTDGGATGASVPTNSDNVCFTSTNNNNAVINASASCLSISFTGGTGYTGTVSGSQALNVRGDFTLSAGMTLTYTGEITFNTNDGNITTAGKTILSAITFNQSGKTWTLQDNLTTRKKLQVASGSFVHNDKTITFDCRGEILDVGIFSGATVSVYNLVIINDANNRRFFYFNRLTVTNNLTITGDSPTNRITIANYTRGIGSTLTANNIVSMENVNFRDITGAGDATWEGTSVGDMGGNTGITFTPAVTRYWVDDGGNWTDTAHWATASDGAGGASVPLPQDTVIFDANSVKSASQTITMNAFGMGKDISFSAVENNPVINSTGIGEVFGSLVFGTMSYTGTAFYLCGRSGTDVLTQNGATISVLIQTHMTSGGKYTVTDDFTTGYGIGIQSGTLDITNRTIEFTGSAVLQQSTSGAMVTTGSTIKCTNNSATAKFFGGANITYNKLWFNTQGTGNVTIYGNNTINELIYDNQNTTAEFRISGNTTQTIKTSFTMNGSSGNVIKLRSTSTTRGTIANDTGGDIVLNYVDIANVHATGDDSYAVNSTDSGNTDGWMFSALSSAISGLRSLAPSF
jgi:hypothetical protein